MTVTLPRIVFISIFALATAACGEDPVAPAQVANLRFSLERVAGEPPPVDVETIESDEVCVHRVRDGYIQFTGDRFVMSVLALRICPSGSYPASEWFQGSFVQDGAQITLTEEVDASTTTIVRAVASERHVRITGRTPTGVEFVLEFRGNFPVNDETVGGGY